MEIDIRSFLEEVFLFRGISSDILDHLAETATSFSLKKNDFLFMQGAEAQAFYILVSGKVSIFKVSKNGDEQTLHFHSSGDIIAEASIFDMAIYPASCRALKDSVLIKIPKAFFVNIIKQNPEMALKMMGSYSRRLRGFVSMVEYLTLDDVKLRILKYFSKRIIRKGDKYLVKMDISKKEMASLLGTVPETFSRNFKKLKEDKIVKEIDQEIEILDIDKFYDLVE